MGWTYDPSQLATSEVMQVRAEIQDTDPRNWLLADEEIVWAISQERNFWAAAARCAEMIARGFLRRQDVKLGRALTVAYAKAASQWFEMAQTLRRKSLGTVVPYVGGQFKSVKFVYSQDSDLIQGTFQRHMMESPWTGGYSPDSLGPFIGTNDDAGFPFE